jgi:outer membrane protein assembly factor BamB
MTTTTKQIDTSSRREPLRLWPGVVIATLVALGSFGLPIVAPDWALGGLIGMLSGLVGAVAVLLWWAFFSRAPRLERWGGAVVMIVAFLATRPFLHESVATGHMGATYFLYAAQTLVLAFVAWAVLSRRLADGPRRATMVAVILLACGGWALVRTYGVSGTGSDFAWRWEETPEERLLAQLRDEPAPIPPASPAPSVLAVEVVAESDAAEAREEVAELQAGSESSELVVAATATSAADVPPAPVAAKPEAEWPGFRGPARDGIAHAARIETNWSASPPVELWRRPVGPGWSSFAVQGDLLYTQEQRGEDEVVACYRVSTGEPVWTHSDPVRFWESNAGAGPRATPTLHSGRVYTFGATGILNALDAGDGSVVWSRNAATDTDKQVPVWAFSGSPLVVGDIVVVAVSGQLAAYDLATGASRWVGPRSRESYSSPHLLTLDGVEQIVLLNAGGATSVTPADGAVLWEHSWPGFTSLQPALTDNGEILITTSGSVGGNGTRRLAAARGPGGWTVEERWTSIGLKPYFNDFVVHEGHAFGFDGRILSCIGLEDGTRKWKGGRFGHGQLLLLPEQDLLLVISERGELALVAATPDQFTELARFPAIEGKTWNHPVVVGDVVVVRNDQEMAAFRLPRAGSNVGATAASGG